MMYKYQTLKPEYGPLIAKDKISGKVEQTVGQNYRADSH